MTWEKLKPVLIEVARIAAVAVAAYFGFKLVPVETVVKVDAPPGVTVTLTK